MPIDLRTVRHVVVYGFISFAAAGCSEKNTEELLRDLRSTGESQLTSSTGLRTLIASAKRGDKPALRGLIDFYLSKPTSIIYRALIEFDSLAALPAHLRCLGLEEKTGVQGVSDKMFALQAIDEIFRSKLKASSLGETQLGKIETAVAGCLKHSQAKNDIGLRLAAINTLEARIRHRSDIPVSETVKNTLVQIARTASTNQSFRLARESLRALGSTQDTGVLPVLVESLFRSSSTYGSSLFEARTGLAQFGDKAATFLEQALSGHSEVITAFFKKNGITESAQISRIAVALGDLHTPRAMEQLTRRVANPNARRSIRISGVIQSICRLGLTQAKYDLAALANDQQANHIARLHAIDSLQYIGDHRVVPALLKVSGNQSEDDVVRSRAISVAAILAKKKQYKRIVAVLNGLSEQKGLNLAVGATTKAVQTYLAESKACKANLSCYIEILGNNGSDLEKTNYAAISMLRVRKGYLGIAALTKAFGRVSDDDRSLLLTVIERLVGHPKAKLEDLKSLQTTLEQSKQRESDSAKAFLGDEIQLRQRLLSIRLGHILSERS